ncbi:MAG: flavodoxin family protein [Lachnospiraceae bacterium]|nr:flavodoxin family protein [Lachnospiraceae bacterium]
MKIVIVNGSYRKHGATAQILNEMYGQLKKYDNVDVEMIHVADLELKYCVGCGNCYKTGECIFKDDIEELSMKIGEADGIILGSPTYASNVSGQMKVIIDRGHFVMEQLLYGKYAIGVTTYENYGGRDSAKVLKRLLSYSGAKISSMIVTKSKFNSNPLEDIRLKRNIEKVVCKFYCDVSERHRYMIQSMKHLIVFRMGILPFVRSKGAQYDGVIKHWKKKEMVGGHK